MFPDLEKRPHNVATILQKKSLACWKGSCLFVQTFGGNVWEIHFRLTIVDWWFIKTHATFLFMKFIFALSYFYRNGSNTELCTGGSTKIPDFLWIYAADKGLAVASTSTDRRPNWSASEAAFYLCPSSCFNYRAVRAVRIRKWLPLNLWCLSISSTVHLCIKTFIRRGSLQ